MLELRIQDSDVRRKSNVLTIVLLGLMAAGIVLAAINIIRGDTQYNLTNFLFILLVLVLLVLNRVGAIRAASLLTVALTTVGALLMARENVATTYIAMPLPILITSYLLTSWSAFVVGALMIVWATVEDIASPALLVLVVVAILSYLFADSLDRAYRENRYRALHDELTGLPNRALFIDLLQQALDHPDGNLLAVLFIDLDKFKVVNDSLGHEAGDDLLILVARRLQACLRRGGIAARLSGDEFTVLLPEVTELGDAVKVAERIATALEDSFELRGRQVFISASVGIALSEDGDGAADTLLSNADVAMYKAKTNGNATYQVFNSDMHNEAMERLELENGLRHAIYQGELVAYYQPKVELSTGMIIGMEALVRWEHPERGLINPMKFIPFAEEIGLIVPLGRWVLREACRQASKWQKQYPTASLVTSVNLSIEQFKQSDLLQETAELLQETKVNPQGLQLEITESTVSSDVEYAVDLLHKLRALGIELAIDDFGTGYSSLMSLQQFPVNELKIDKVFIDGIGKNAQDIAITKLVIDLAHAVGVRATAEGVETADQLAQLKSMGCDQAQGYYFCGPLSGDAATDLLGNIPRWLIDYHHPGEHSRNPDMPLEGQG